MNATQNKKYAALAQGFAKPRRTNDLHIYFMECMEQIEFAGNNNAVREQFFQLFESSRKYWFSETSEHSADFFDRIYKDTEEMLVG
jgi:hypothetical protein